MEQDAQIELLEECRNLAENRSTHMKTDSNTLISTDRYQCPKRFTLEMENILLVSPMILAHSSELTEPNSFKTLDVQGFPLLLTRGEGGEVNGLVNVCRHRGAKVESRESGVSTRFSCPYHGWTYKSKGELIGVPHSVAFPELDKSCNGLQEISIREKFGFIWGVLKPQPGFQWDDFVDSDFENEINGLGMDDLALHARFTQDWQCNWKLISEGGMESYHFKVAHKDTIAALFLDNCSAYQFYGRNFRSILPKKNISELDPADRNQWSIRETSNVLYGLFPGTSFLVQPEHVAVVITEPLAVDKVRMEILTLVPKNRIHSEEDVSLWDFNHKITVDVLTEDFDIAESIQAGLKTGVNQTFNIGRNESALKELNDLIDELL